MKRYINPIADGGAPIFLDDLISSDVETYTAIAAIVDGFNEVVILSGCILSNIAIGSVDISAGVVFIDGEVRESPAYSGAYPIYLEAAADVITTRDFEDGTTENLFSTKSAIYTASLPGGNYIQFNPTTKSRFADVLKRSTTKEGEIITSSLSSTFFDGSGLGFDHYSGFALCNGSNGTVDLRGRFLVGQDTTDIDYTNIGDTGGLKNVTLDVSQMPAHNHTISNNQNFLYFTASGAGWGPSGTGAESTPSIDNTGGGLPHENRPPFFTLAFIQRV